MLTMQEIEPLALCIATQNMFDRRFISSFGDNVILKDRDPDLERSFLKIKREMSSGMTSEKYLEGHKMNILYNMDKLLVLVSRFVRVDMRNVETIASNLKDIMKRVVEAGSFGEIDTMESMFKSQVTLPIYELYVKQTKGENTNDPRRYR